MKAIRMYAILSLSILSVPTFANECIDNFNEHVYSNILFFAQCQLNDNDLKPIVAYANSHPDVNYIRLDENNLGDQGLKTLALLQNTFESIDLHNNQIHDSSSESLKKIPVMALDLSDNPIDTTAIKAIAENPTLKALSIRNTQVDAGIVDIFKSNLLQYIDIASDALSSEVWEKIGETSQQYDLVVAGKNLDDGFAAGFSKNSSVYYLGLGINKISLNGFTSLMQNSSMISLMLDNMRENSGVFEAIGNAQHSSLSSFAIIIHDTLKLNCEIAKKIAKNTTLTSLGIYNISSEPSIDLDFAKEIIKSNSITKLTIYDNDMDDAKAIAIANSKNITELEFPQGNIGDEGAIDIAQMRELRNAYLNMNHISDNGALAFIDKKNMETLDLSSNHISDGAINKLKANLNIEHLYLENQFQDAGRVIKNREILNKRFLFRKQASY
jgi:Leucine-rich repeat (LRR) protein